MFFEGEKKPQDFVENYLTERPYLSGLLTGLVAGLAIGVLFAPRSGKDLRKQVADTVNDQTKEAKNQWNKTKAQGKEAIDSIKTNVGLTADKAENEFNAYVDKAVKYADKAEEEANKAVEEAAQLASKTRSDIDHLKNTPNIS